MTEAESVTGVGGEARRLAYLRALGVQVWQRRVPASTASPRPVAAVEQVARPNGMSSTADTAPAPAGFPDDWSSLAAEVAACRRCDLHRSRTQTVFGVGDHDADWLVVGEAPGEEEDLTGEPFVGRAGRLLDQMLLAVGLDRSRVYIANVLKCRPPGNRDPQAAETAECIGYLHRQIVLLQPRIILVVGRVAAQALLGQEQPLGRMRGRAWTLPGGRTPVVATYHPAYLLRKPSEKAKAWQDLLLARRLYNDATGKDPGEAPAAVRG